MARSIVLLPVFLLLLIGGMEARGAASIKTAAELRSLLPQEAAKNIPVTLTGIVTCYDPDGARLYVQDDTDGFGVGLNWSVSEDTRVLIKDLIPGTEVEVSGVTSQGVVAPFIAGSGEHPLEIKVRGESPLPEAVDLGRSRRPTLQLHGVRAEVRGYVQSAERKSGALVLQVLRGGDMLEVLLQDRTDPAGSGARLVAGDVIFSGVLALSAERESGLTRPRLIVTGSDRVEALDPGLKYAFSRTPETVQTARLYASEEGSRLTFRGHVLGGIPGRILYVRVQKAGLRVRSPLIPNLELGNQVDIAGFPMIRDGELFIEDAVVHVRDANETLQPVSIQFGELPKLKDDANLIRMSARLSNQLARSSDTMLLLQSGSSTFYARSFQVAPDKEWPALEPGSLLELTGICDLSPSSTGGGTFTLLIRGVDDIRLVQPPPFWTPRRLLVPALLVVFVIFATFAWIILLRRKLRAQTALIVQKVERERIAEERDRIARDLHDSLEQHLAGMAIQVDLASSRLRTSVERAGQSLDVVRALVRRGHEETRHAVWQLRSGAVARGDLPAALAEALEWYSPDLPIAITVTGSARPLPPTATHHMLRVAQEAVGNALKHGQPSHIQITLDYGESLLGLRVQDDGKGFDPASVPAFIPGHFGLAGMRERLQKLGGEFRIDSQPGHGTTVFASIPWSRLPMTEIPTAASNA